MRIGFGGRGLAAVALVCHLLTTFGFPVPAPSLKNGDVPFPCQTRPCGCLTADECWKGDCCCFTLEEKLRWAEENGVEPPAHVRPLVESRKSQPVTPKPKKSCCSEPAEAAPTCCEARAPAPVPVSHPEADCPRCAGNKAAAGERPPAAPQRAEHSGVRWVAGVYAQKCRGQGPAGLFLHDPAFVPAPPLVLPAAPDRDRPPVPRSEHAVTVPHVPPTPPPRAS